MNSNNIYGFFNFHELYLEQIQKASENDIFVEVGTLWGKSLAFLAQEAKKANKKINIHSVDFWDIRGVPELQVPGADPTGLDYTKDGPDCIYNKFIQNMKDCNVMDIITPHRMSSEEGSQKFVDNSIDFLFIDAGHTYDDVKKDLDCWYPKVQPGKVISGHDYDWSGVKRAVDEFFGEENIQVYNTSWVYTKPLQTMYTFIIPYRDRKEHLSVLLPAIQSKMRYANYEIIIAEQNDQEKFKLSSLYNIAYKEATGDVIIFHDVDYIPTRNVNYTLKNNNPTYPVKQVIFLDKDHQPKKLDTIPQGYRHFHIDVGNHWGGVFILHRDHFKSINGFNPLYVGWGKEEEETHLRILEKGLVCERNSSGLFYALEHVDNCPSLDDQNFINNHHLLNKYKTNLHIGYKNITADVEKYQAGDKVMWLKIKNFKYEN